MIDLGSGIVIGIVLASAVGWIICRVSRRQSDMGVYRLAKKGWKRGKKKNKS